MVRRNLTFSQDHYDLLVTKSGTIDDLIAALVKKAKIPDEVEGGKIRVYETNSHKYSRELPRDYPVISINEYVRLVAERVPEEELDQPDDSSAYIQVFHFQNEPSRVHGMPFRFLLKEGEPFSETKKRLEKRTGLKGKSFERIKFAVVRRSHFSKPHYLKDGEFRDELKPLAAHRYANQLKMIYSGSSLPRTTTSSV